MPFKSEKQRKWMHANEPEMAKRWEKKKKKEALSGAELKKAHKKFKDTGELPPHLKKLAKELDKVEKKFKVKDIVVPGLEWMSKIKEEAKRDYKDEYKKFQSSTKSKKYRAELNKYNRKKGTYGNGDGKDASHKGGKIAGFEAESKNRGRAEKSRLKGEGFGGQLKGKDKEKFEKARKENAEQLGYTLTGKSDIKKAINEANIIQKIDKLAKANKYGTVDGTQMNGKTAREIIAMFKHPKMNSHRNQMLKMKSHELVDLSIRLLKPLKIKIESDLGITTKKGKTVKAVHKTSGKEIVVVDTPSSRKKLKRMGFKVESVNEAPMAYSSPEAKQQLDSDIVSMSKVLGKASQQVIKIMMNGVKGGRYDAMDIPRGIETGPLNRTHEGERPFMKMLWRKVRSGFRRYSPKGKLRK